MKSNRHTIFLLFLLLLSSSIAEQSTEYIFPTQTWHYADNQELAYLGWSADRLKAVENHLENKSASTGVVVVDRGRVVYTYGNIEELSYIASMRKSVLAILYGPWVADGSIHLEATLADLDIDDVGGLLPQERKATLRHLLSARSGVYHVASNTGDDTDQAPARGSQEPGNYMLYNNWDFNAAGGIFEQLTKQDIFDELERQLALPLQFEDWNKQAQRKTGKLTKSRFPAYHMWLSTRDTARIGHLMLSNGNWRGEQRIPQEWIHEITTVITPLHEMNPSFRQKRYFGYGMMWWIWDGPAATGPFSGAYTARGAYGQWISVFPAIDIVIAHKTNDNQGLTTSWSDWQTLIELVFAAKGIQPTSKYPWAH